MAVLTVQNIDLDGLEATFSSADVAGDTFTNDGRTYLHVKNGGAGAIQVTVDSTTNCNQGFDHDAVVSIPASEERIIGIFPTARFSSTASVTYDVVTSVTVAAIKCL